MKKTITFNHIEDASYMNSGGSSAESARERWQFQIGARWAVSAMEKYADEEIKALEKEIEMLRTELKKKEYE